MIRGIEYRAASLFGLHMESVEPIQLVNYKPGEFYKTHHDSGAVDDEDQVIADDPTFSRLVTISVYLNDVEEGGETYFPKCGLKVKPEAGKAVS